LNKEKNAMKTHFRKLNILVSAMLFLAMLLGLALPSINAAAVGTTILVDNLQPSWTALGGGGVFSAYVGPPAYGYVSPGATALYDGREAGIIKAGINIDPTYEDYEDEGLFGFIPNISIDSLAAGTLSYDFDTQAGVNPIWMTIEIDTGLVGDRDDNVTYQHVPSSNPAGWHTVDAAAGLWQKWNNSDGDVSGNPKISLAAVAAAYPGLNVVRAYLRLGMGNSYNNGGTGTIAWVDKVILNSVTYDFILSQKWYVSKTGLDTNTGTQASPFLTIQKAIDSAAPTDTIYVAAGTYAQALNITKSLTIQGPQAGVDVGGRTAAGPTEATIQGLTTLDASNVNINGFTLTNPGGTYALVIQNHTPSNSNISFAYNIVDNVGSTSLTATVHSIDIYRGADNVTIAHNRFNNIKSFTMSANGIGVIDSGSTDASEGLLIQDNTFTDIASGQKGAYGIIINNKIGAPSAQILNNYFCGLNGGGWTHAIGLEGPTPGATISNNIFCDLVSATADKVAVWFEANSGGGTVTVIHNLFDGTIFYGVGVIPSDISTYGYTVNAAENWWGDISGPGPVGSGTGALVGPNVTFSPWCANETCTTNPPPTPSSFWGYLYFLDGIPMDGSTLEAYIPDVTGTAATVVLHGTPPEYFAFNVPGDIAGTTIKEGGVENDPITFKIAGRVVATALWHGGTNVELDLHPPMASAGGPYVGLVNTAITFAGSASDGKPGGDTAAYSWDLDYDTVYGNSLLQNPSYTFDTIGTKTIGLKVTDGQGGEGTATATVSVISIAGLSGQTYDGTQKSVTVTGVESPLTFTVTYNGDEAPPVNAGSYPVVITLSNGATYSGINMVIGQASSSVVLNCPASVTYTGSPLTPCIATATGAGGLSVPLAITYANNTNAGTASADASYAGDVNHTGNSAHTTFTILPATATITVTKLDQIWDGTQKSVDVATTPGGLLYTVTYNGDTNPPTDPGSYTVVVTINSGQNYAGTTTVTMHILQSCTIDLVTGWNLVSPCLSPANTDPAAVLNSLSGKYDLVYAWDGAKPAGSNWEKFAPGGPSYANNMPVLDEKMGFWIRMTHDATLTIGGNVPTTTTIPLSITGGGWNLVGYPSLTPWTLPGTLDGHFTLIYAYHASETADPWKLFDIDAPVFVDDLLSLTAKWGYWIKVGTPYSWMVTY
jgi:hypothetical protein